MASHRPHARAWPLGQIATMLSEWANAPTLASLVAAFDGPVYSGTVAERLTAIERFASEAWDLRRQTHGASLERNQLPQVDLTAAQRSAIHECAEALGLLTSVKPRHHDYEHVLILGGLVPSNLRRSEYAAHLLRDGLSCRQIWGVTAFRPLSRNFLEPQKDEHYLLDFYGLPRLRTEYSVMEYAVERAFDPTRSRVGGETGPLTATREINLTSPTVSVAGQRATTQTSLAHWTEVCGNLHPSSRVLLITTTPYVRYQQLIALKELALPFGVEVDTVGVDDALVRTQAPWETSATELLQELRSLARAHHALLSSLPRQAAVSPVREAV